MKKAFAIVVAVFWLAALMGRHTHAQGGDERKEPPELEAVAKKAEAEGKANEIPAELGATLGLANKEPIPIKALALEREREQKGASTFSYKGRVWVMLALATSADTIEVFLTQPDGVLRGAALLRIGKGWTVIPLSEAAERFAVEKAFWKEYVSKASKP